VKDCELKKEVRAETILGKAVPGFGVIVREARAERRVAKLSWTPCTLRVRDAIVSEAKTVEKKDSLHSSTEISTAFRSQVHLL
jgi:hypothetical protein